MVQLFSFAVVIVGGSTAALACPFEEQAEEQASAKTAGASIQVVVSVDPAAAAHCARSSALVGSNCSYSTGMMARRVVEEGRDWSWEGALSVTPNTLASTVAAPFSAGTGTHVIANELVESLSGGGLVQANLALAGKLLEVDGVRYVVLTSYKVISS